MSIDDLVIQLLGLKDLCGGDAEVFVVDMKAADTLVLKSIQGIDAMQNFTDDGKEIDVKTPVIGV